MSQPNGVWDLTLRTPVGRQEVELVIERDDDERLVGTARSRAETVALEHLAVEGDHLTWSQAVTRPMRLRLDFDVTLDGDQLTGHSRAGHLPRSHVTGQRRGG